jgi:peptide/nickel transport system substrate-binding protein
MGTTTRQLVLCVVSLALAAGGAACAKKKEGGKKEGTAGKVGEPEAGGDARAHAKPRQGGQLILPAGSSGASEPEYLNPILETNFTRANALIFEGLVGLSTSLEPVPVLAESWQSSADGKKLTFKLRSGVKWQDGKPFTSKDVQFTFQAIRDTTKPTVWKTYFAAVEKLETPDEHTVVVTYSRPYAPAIIAWTVGIIPAHVYGGGKLHESKGNKEPVGTGPFRLARWEAGKSLLFEANRAWWNGRPNLDQVTLRVDVEDPLKALRAGEVDLTQVPDVQAWSTEAQVPDFRADFEVATVHGSLFRMIAWNVQKAPFDDQKVRLALTLALNRSRVIEDVFLSQAQAMSAPMFPNMIGPDPSIAPHPFDLGKASALLDEAGKKAGPNGRFAVQIITVASQKTATTEEMFAIFRRDYSAIGIDLKVEYLSRKEFGDRLVMRDFDAVYLGWFPDIPDPDPSALLHSSQIKVGQNFAGYSDPDVDKLLEAAVATSNRDERKALYQKLHAKLHADLPYTVLYSPYTHFAWSRRAHGVSPDDIGPQPRFPGIAGWWVEK